MVFRVVPPVSSEAAFVCSYSHVFSLQTICSNLSGEQTRLNHSVKQSLHFSVSSVKLSLRWESTCRNTLPVPGTVSLRGERCMSNDSITEPTQWKWAPSDRQAAESLKPAWLPLLLAFMISRFRVGSTTQFHLITVVKRTVRAVHDGAD